MKPLILILLIALTGCASKPQLTLQEKYAGYSTGQLQLKRQQLNREIPNYEIKLGIFGKDYDDEREELNEIEIELQRRFESGDKEAVLQPLSNEGKAKMQFRNF